MVWLLLPWMACHLKPTESGPPPADPVTAPQQEEAAAPPGLREEMRQHSADALAAREALVVADLAAAQAAGRALAGRLPLAALPAAPQEPVRAAALALASAPSIEVAARHFGELSVACGGCHQAVQASPRLPSPDAPPPEESFEAQMQRYHWAAERMWQGLVLPSETAIEEARAQLRALPTASFRTASTATLPLPLGAETLDAALHEQAQQVAIGQGQAYGAMLLMCAACHTLSPASPAHD